ncbi:MAG: hypothetical protein J7M19_03870 [Planctomycetes bacterium]|nr:hypothetical protein [Planctomycetota bacterium]
MSRNRSSEGFTLAELCVVMGIASIIAGMTVAVGLHARASSAVKSAQASVAVLETALVRFEAKSGSFPKDLNHDGITTTEEIVKQLKDWAMLDESFSLVDPWGKTYVIVLRRDYGVSPDTKLDINLFPINDYAGGFQVLSPGPDGETACLATAEASLDDVGNCS